MVLGAGLGTRMKPFTDQTPKPLIPLLGVPTIEYALRSLQAAGVTRAVVNTHAHADQLERYCASAPVPGLDLHVSSEREKLLGSAGGFRHALPLLGAGPFIAVNADVINLVPLDELIRRHQKLRAERKVSMTLALLSGEWLQAQSGEYRKIEVNEATGLINGYSETKMKNTPFYSGVGIFEPEAFEHLPDGEPSEFVPQVLEPLIRKKKVGFLNVDALWMDIGSPDLWWRAHFDLYERYLNHALPAVWAERIETGLPTCHIRLSGKTVDYSPGMEPALGKNSIRLHHLSHAIPNVGNL
jgi:NDP-sugar pyrophosphorylase family protein